jgi:hypothetical protein
MNIPDTDLPPLPEPDTISLAMSGRSVDYINGYERGFESCRDQLREAQRQAIAHYLKMNEGKAVLTVGVEPDYFNRGHYYKGQRPHIDPLEVQKLPIGTKLFLTPMSLRVDACSKAIRAIDALHAAGLVDTVLDIIHAHLAPQPQVEAAVMADAERWRAFRAAWHEIDGSCDTLMGGLAVADSHADIDAAVDAAIAAQRGDRDAARQTP